MITGIGISPHFRRGGGAAYCDEYKLVLDAMTVKPSADQSFDYNRMIAAMADGGALDALDVFQYYAVHSNENGEALLNWKSPGVIDASLHGTVVPSFTENKGFKGSIANAAYLNTHFNGVVINGEYQQDSASIGIYMDTLSATICYMGIQHSGVYSQFRVSTVNVILGLNQGSEGIQRFTYDAFKGLYIINRDASDSIDRYFFDEYLSAHDAVSSAVPNADFILFGKWKNTQVENFNELTHACFFAGSKLTLELIKVISSAIETCYYYAGLDKKGHIPLLPLPRYLIGASYYTGVQQGGLVTLGDKIYMSTASFVFFAYDINKNQWERKADIYAGNNRQSGVLNVVNGKIYHIGGLDSSTSTYYGDVNEYDPDADTWTPKTAMPTPREDFGSAVIDGKIYCFGGLKNGGSTKVMEIYDVATDTWDSSKASLPVNKQLGDFGCAVNGKIYAIGASDVVYVEHGDDEQYVIPDARCYVYDPVTDIWSSIANIPEPTVYSERAVIGNYIYSVGGAVEGEVKEPSSHTENIYRYNTIDNTWQLMTAKLPYGSQGSAITVYNGKIYYFGGAESNVNISKFYKLNI